MNTQVRIGNIALAQADAGDGQFLRRPAQRHRPRQSFLRPHARQSFDHAAFDRGHRVARDGGKLHITSLAENAVGWLDLRAKVPYGARMRAMTKVAFGVCLASITSVAAWAVADGSKDDKAAVIQMMHSIMPKTAYDAMLDQMYTQMSASMAQAQGGKEMPPAKLKALKAAVQECMPYDDLVSWNADVYTKHFSRKEIDDLAAFYNTPTGKKFATKLPALSGDLAQKMMPVLMTRLPAALKKHGLE